MTKIPVNIPQITPVMISSAGKATDMENKGDFGKILEEQKKLSADEAQAPEKESGEEAVEFHDENEKESVETSEEVQNAEVSEEEPVTEVTQQGETSTGKEEAFQDSEGIIEGLVLQILPMLNAVCTDMKELLAQELGISVEELDITLENLGIAETDLLDWNTVKDVFLQVKGTDDVAMLLTDERLYEGIQNLEKQFSEIMENVQETLDLSEEELVALKEQIVKQTKTQSPLNESVEEPVVNSLNSKDNESQSAAQNQGTTDSQQENAFTPPQYGYSVNQNSNMQQVTQISAPQELIFANVDAENIMNQIIDYMKIQTDVQSSTMELQLQPESLGTLQIRISAREGVMTAQFTTASEVVKAVLESQIVQLQQQLESQNIKVDSIEVAVQTYGFESALEQGKDRQQMANDKRNRNRRIDLSRLEGTENISEEERLVAEMMAQNGNTVDYLV